MLRTIMIDQNLLGLKTSIWLTYLYACVLYIHQNALIRRPTQSYYLFRQSDEDLGVKTQSRCWDASDAVTPPSSFTGDVRATWNKID